MHDDKIQRALDLLALDIKHAKISLAHAEKREGVTEGEIDALKEKIALREYMQDLVLKEAG